MRKFYTLILILLSGLAIFGASRFTPSAAPDHVVESQALMKEGRLIDCDLPHAFRMSAQRLRHTAWCTFGPENGDEAEP